ncbi:hypothetical protein V6N13_059723 [Hibiscus sabdariffa]
MTKKKMEANSGVSICRCGQQADVVTAWTDENPGRRFFGCKNYGKGLSFFCLVRCSCQPTFKSDNLWALKESEENGKVVAPGMMKDAFQVAALEMMEDAFRIAAAGMMDVVFL